ncbi:hypothetical protein VNO77_07476 [Canavalia gladiata]|uniref:Uncharacterized protein n=1 Tax=Canavalia gladiata TaxID=3824 RepID=A0AAN9MD69_CANGL
MTLTLQIKLSRFCMDHAVLFDLPSCWTIASDADQVARVAAYNTPSLVQVQNRNTIKGLKSTSRPWRQKRLLPCVQPNAYAFFLFQCFRWLNSVPLHPKNGFTRMDSLLGSLAFSLLPQACIRETMSTTSLFQFFLLPSCWTKKVGSLTQRMANKVREQSNESFQGFTCLSIVAVMEFLETYWPQTETNLALKVLVWML